MHINEAYKCLALGKVEKTNGAICDFGPGTSFLTAVVRNYIYI